MNQDGETNPLEGQAIDIDESGRLLVKFDSGDTRAVAVADVEHLRLQAR